LTAWFIPLRLGHSSFSSKELLSPNCLDSHNSQVAPRTYTKTLWACHRSILDRLPASSEAVAYLFAVANLKLAVAKVSA
jgi:hypothetical protein